MKVYLLKSTACYQYGRLGFVFTLVNSEQLETLKSLLPWYEVIGEKDLKDLPISDTEILENYKKLFYSQPEIRKNKISDDPGYLWHRYTLEADQIFNDQKSVRDQIKSAVPKKIDDDWREYLYRELILEIAVQGYDDSGSFMYSELENNLGALRVLCLTNDRILEIDWREVYDKRSLLLELACPSYSMFLEIVKRVYGSVNVEIGKDGSTHEYIPETDEYRCSENIKLKEFVDRSRTYQEKLKKICTTLIDGKLTIEDLSWLPGELRRPIEILGTTELRALGFQKSCVEKEIRNKEKEKLIYGEIKKIFRIGEKYPYWFITEKLREIFKNHDYQKPPLAATNMRKVFYTSRVNLRGKDGKWCRGLKIIGVKEE